MGVPQGVNISGPVVPTFDTDVFPTHIDTWGKGGWTYVNDNTERDAIPPERRSIGMAVLTLDSGIRWFLDSDLTTWFQSGAYACKTIVLKSITPGTDILDLFTTPGVDQCFLVGIKANCRSNIATQDLIIDIKIDGTSIFPSENLLTFATNTFTNGIITLDIILASGSDVTIEMEFSL